MTCPHSPVNDLEALRFHWGDAYQIGFSDKDGWHARRRDGEGGLLTGASPGELYRAVNDDYTAWPVPRRFTPGG